MAVLQAIPTLFKTNNYFRNFLILCQSGENLCKTMTRAHSFFSPGEGGDSPSIGPSSSSGGGGGGVLIDGKGPNRPRESYGQGYGGGASELGVGLPGAVILDFAPDE